MMPASPWRDRRRQYVEGVAAWTLDSCGVPTSRELSNGKPRRMLSRCIASCALASLGLLGRTPAELLNSMRADFSKYARRPARPSSANQKPTSLDAFRKPRWHSKARNQQERRPHLQFAECRYSTGTSCELFRPASANQQHRALLNRSSLARSSGAPPMVTGNDCGSRPASTAICRKAGMYCSGSPAVAFGYHPSP